MAGLTRKPPAREQARIQTPLLALICLLTCVAIGAVWFYRTTGRRTANVSDKTSGQELVALSAGTKAVLERIDSPIEIRFYALLDGASGSASLPRLAARVDQLLAAYQQEAGGRIKLIRYHAQSDSKAAAADGIKPFNLDNGDAGYLGLAVVHNGQTESFPQLAPEWEQALESDVSRAIARLINAPASVEAAAAVAQIDPDVVAEVKRRIPNFASVSVEEGTRILRESAIQDFQAMANEMEIQLREAEQRVQQAQNGNSEAERQASLQQLQLVRADHAAKLKETTARSAAQLEALRRLKESAR